MAQTTFSGPVRSLAGFITAGVNSTINLAADTTLTVADHAGKIIFLDDADGKFTLKEGECMGSCGDAPVLLVNNQRMCSFMSNEAIDKVLEELSK